MTDRLPYEPMSYQWEFMSGPNMGFGDEQCWGFVQAAMDEDAVSILEDDKMHVTLANGQKIIVKAKPVRR